MPSTNNNISTPSRSPSIINVQAEPIEAGAPIVVQNETPEDTMQAQPHVEIARVPTPPLALSRPQSHQSSSSTVRNVPVEADAQSVSEAADFPQEVRDAIKLAKQKPFGQLVREASTTTSGARGIMKVMTYIGLGVSLGLLFAHQPFAVVLVTPAFTALGIGISFVMRSFLNQSQNPSLEAFKEVMAERLANPSPQDAQDPDFAEAKKVYGYLTQSFTSLGKAHLHETFAKLSQTFGALQNALAEKPVVASSDESIKDNGDAAVVDKGEPKEDEADTGTVQLQRSETGASYKTAPLAPASQLDGSDSDEDAVLVDPQDAQTPETTSVPSNAGV